MKIRPLFILILFVLSTAVLGWIVYTATRRPEAHPPHDPQRDEILADLDACCRRKHAKSMQYEYFAEIASLEHHEPAARLFRAMALSERVHEALCAEAIGRLGGHYEPPVRVMVFRSTTDGNLERSIRCERQSLADRCGREVQRALTSGNRYAAQVLARADAGDLQHVVLMEQHRHPVPPEDSVCRYAVCPACGNLLCIEHEPEYCPFCLTEQTRFILFR